MQWQNCILHKPKSLFDLEANFLTALVVRIFSNYKRMRQPLQVEIHLKWFFICRPPLFSVLIWMISMKFPSWHKSANFLLNFLLYQFMKGVRDLYWIWTEELLTVKCWQKKRFTKGVDCEMIWGPGSTEDTSIYIFNRFTFSEIILIFRNSYS